MSYIVQIGVIHFSCLHQVMQCRTSSLHQIIMSTLYKAMFYATLICNNLDRLSLAEFLYSL
jgi:hypothetical protein